VVLDPNKDDSEIRQQQILANLKNFEATTPDIFNNKAEYDKIVGRANKSPLQQQMVDTYFNNVKTTRDKVAAVDKAKVELSSMDDTTLGYLKPTEEQLSIINNDPVLLARYTQATMNRNILDSIQKGMQPVDNSNILDGVDGIAGNITQEITAQKDAMTAKKLAYDNAVESYNNTETEVREQLQ
jgi:hypothetical protein